MIFSMILIGAVTTINILVAAGVYMRTKRPGPTLFALVTGIIIIVVVAAKGTSVMQWAGTAVLSIVKTIAGPFS